MKKVILSLGAALMISGASAQVNWKIDNSHTKVGFAVTHMMVSEVDGTFKVFEGTATSKSETDFTDANINFKADASSINTDDAKRDGHLKSPDFFDVAKYPEITFKSVSMKRDATGKTSYILEGDLTMHGVTKRVKLTAIGAARTVKDPYGNIKYGFKVTGKINRKDFGLNWNAALEAGGVAVSEDVDLVINIELNKA